MATTDGSRIRLPRRGSAAHPRFPDRAQLTISFFIVGQDAVLAKNHAALRGIAAAGHEIGNHSFQHEPWLHLYTEAELDAELQEAEEAIESLRASGPGLPRAGIQRLRNTSRGWRAVATTATRRPSRPPPPPARAYYFLERNRSPKSRSAQRPVRGSWEGLRPLTPECGPQRGRCWKSRSRRCRC